MRNGARPPPIPLLGNEAEERVAGFELAEDLAAALEGAEEKTQEKREKESWLEMVLEQAVSKRPTFRR